MRNEWFFVWGAPKTLASLQNEPVINPLWDQEAEYSYYAHGPLARTELGEEKVQGLDYVYTLQGWIKGVNSNNLNTHADPGQDGSGLSATHYVAADVFGYSLHYFTGDYYSSIGGDNSFSADQNGSDLEVNSSNLYNGNIARMVTTITDPNTRDVLPLGNAYRYDQLNRLAEARSFNNLDIQNNYWPNGGSEMYYNRFMFDANGNIVTQYRADENNVSIDELNYQYETGYNGAPRNRLSYVSDGSGNTDPNELADQSSGNYLYDAEGRLIYDQQEEIDQIQWRVDGKVKKIVRSNGSQKKNVSFDYDAMGHRIAKHVYTSNDVWEKSTYYVLDAQGNTLSTYEYASDDQAQTLTYAQTEKHIYGSSRLGVNAEVVPLYGSQNATYSMKLVQHKIGQRTYELSNHLGNVLSIISDKVIPHDNNGTVDYYMADIRHSQDYSPFGVTLHGRDLSLSTTGNKPYRYGAADGQEKVDEISGNGSHYTAQYWEYDARLARRWNLDPVKKVHESPYACFANNPIWFTDKNGADSAKVGGKDYWMVQHGDDYGTISKRTGVSVENLKKWNTQDPLNLKSGTLLNLEDNGRIHFVYEKMTPEIYQLTVSGLKLNPAWMFLTYNGPYSPQTEANRKTACPRGYCARSGGNWCDEFPYACTQEGGTGAITDCVPPMEQRIQAGQIRWATNGLHRGDQFMVVTVPDKDKQPQKKTVPVSDPTPKLVPTVQPVMQPLVPTPPIVIPRLSPRPAYVPAGGMPSSIPVFFFEDFWRAAMPELFPPKEEML